MNFKMITLIDDLKDKIKIAEKTVKDVKDPNLKQKAFEVVLKQLLGESPQVGMTASRQVSPGIASESQSTQLSNFLKNTGISDDDFSSVVDIDEEGHIHIIQNIPGKSISMRQRNATVLILTIRHHLLGEREIQSKELRSMLKDLGIGSLPNLAANLKGFENYILFKGKKGSPIAIYRITNPGLNYGIDLIRRLVTGDGK